MSANCVRIPSSKRPAKLPRVASSSGENHTQPARKVQPLRIPPGKIIKAQAMLAEGHSQREVSRTLHMSGHTVAKVVRTEDFVAHIKQMQERLFAIAPDALESFRARVKTDGELAYTFLKDIGIIPSREAMVNMMTGALQPAETGIERQARMIGYLMLEGREHFGIILPSDVKEALAKESEDPAQSANVQPRLPAEVMPSD